MSILYCFQDKARY